MELKAKQEQEMHVRFILFCVAELFTVYSIIRFSVIGDTERILLSVATVFLLCVPYCFERLFSFRLCLPLYTFCLFYALGAILGHAYKFYYLLPGWDKMLHLFGGIAFAIVGYYLPQRYDVHGKNDRILYAVCALCLSMAVALLWEFFEYAMDCLFDMNMQSGTVIHSITSYALGDEMGAVGRIKDIEEIVVNGQSLGVGGYLDTGIIDTMNDTLFESLGALLTAGALAWDNGRHPILRWNEKTQKEWNTEIRGMSFTNC